MRGERRDFNPYDPDAEPGEGWVWMVAVPHSGGLRDPRTRYVSRWMRGVETKFDPPVTLFPGDSLTVTQTFREA